MKNLIEVKELSKSYGGLHAVDRVTWVVPEGSITGLLGSNGAGKTTTLKIVAGILPITRGKVRIAGYALPEQHLEAKRVIGYLRAFARGVYWALWVQAVGLPHFALLPFMIRFWGWKEAALVAAFSLIVVSLYLGFQIKMISGLPFSYPFNESRATFYVTYIQIRSLSAIMIPTTLQWALFQLWWVALLAGVFLAILTWFAVHWTLGELEGEMRWRLHIMKMGTTQMFREFE